MLVFVWVLLCLVLVCLVVRIGVVFRIMFFNLYVVSIVLI